MPKLLTNIDIFPKADDLMHILRTAVRKAQAESRRLGVPNVYWIDGERYYELPDGEISRTRPMETESVG